MGVFEFIVVITVVTAVGSVAKEFVAKRSAGADEARVRALEAALQANETRLAATEDKVADLNEKLTFVENLLAKPESHAPLPPPSQGAPGATRG